MSNKKVPLFFNNGAYRIIFQIKIFLRGLLKIAFRELGICFE